MSWSSNGSEADRKNSSNTLNHLRNRCNSAHVVLQFIELVLTRNDGFNRPKCEPAMLIYFITTPFIN